MKNVEFCRKTSQFLPKRSLFIFCIFYLNEKELNQQVCLIKYIENEILTISKTFLKLLKNFNELHQLLIITNHFYHLWSDPDENLENKNWCEILNLVIVTSNKLYFYSLHERFKYTANKHRELNFCHQFYPFIYKSGNAWVKYLIVAQAAPY